MAPYALIPDVRADLDVPRGGILSRTVHTEGTLTLTLFAFDAGQELTGHTSTRAAIIEILDGEAEVILDGDVHALRPGAWIAMPPGLTHAIKATTPMRMALTLL
jgi:quercetin dioxygenase-like cupin family protein